ncbi:MAG TPA: hypothetical protein ENK57_24455, partial [Polyangiaceae bacterium]|nr:hypothetical protein [Polyangiaceae bacterium]
MKRLLLSLLLAATAWLWAGALFAQQGQGGGGEAPPSLDIMVAPIFGPATLPPGGWGEVLVRIQNNGKDPYEGEVIAYGGYSRHRDEAFARTAAPFSVGVGAQVSLRIPVRISELDLPTVQVLSTDDKLLFEQQLTRADDNRTLLVDVSRASALGPALRGIPVGSSNDPWAPTFRGHPTSGAASTTVNVTSPVYDPVTGDPLLPRRAASYSRVAALLMRTDELTRLGAEELQALAGWIMGGGTLALVVARPEDLRHPTIVSLLGDEAEQRDQIFGETMAELTLTPPSHVSPYGSAPPQPSATRPDKSVEETLVSYAGGNLHPTPYGSSAAYGLGEVHLLAFDPQTKPAVDSAWVHVRMVDLLRRANARADGIIFRPGEPHAVAREVRRELDPNESSRWSIVVTALLLCLYAIVAGPLNFTLWRRRGRPLRALVWLPVISGAAFAAVVVVGVVAKGCSGRARHLTVVEAGAGMERGIARRWRGFFVPTSRELTVRTGNGASVLGTELMDHGDPPVDRLRLDRDGLRLVELNLRPWETLVVREDGDVDLGGGVAISRNASGEVVVTNRTGKRLRGVIVWDPSTTAGTTYFHEALEDGQSVATSAMTVVRGVAAGIPHSGSTIDFDVYVIDSELDRAAAGLSDAWMAVIDAIPAYKSWFTSTVPVMLAQIEGGEG